MLRQFWPNHKTKILYLKGNKSLPCKSFWGTLNIIGASTFIGWGKIWVALQTQTLKYPKLKI